MMVRVDAFSWGIGTATHTHIHARTYTRAPSYGIYGISRLENPDVTETRKQQPKDLIGLKKGLK